MSDSVKVGEARAGDLYYASIGFGVRRLGFILKTAGEAEAREDAEKICAMLAALGAQVTLLSLSRVALG